MSPTPNRVWRPLGRLSPVHARRLAGLAIVVLVIAATGPFTYSGIELVVFVVWFVAIGLGNLAWAVGSLLPDEERGRRVRAVAFPFFVVMLVAMVAWLVRQVTGRG